MRKLLLCVVWFLCTQATAGQITDLLLPESLVGDDMQMDVDWLIEDTGSPESGFAKAVAGPMKAMGIKASVSATYVSVSNDAELYLLEAYEYSKSFSVREAVSALKPGIADITTVSDTQIAGHEATKFVAAKGTKILCYKFGDHLIILGVVNDVADLNAFAERYVAWFSEQSFDP